jgi:hypothetical protein
MARSDSTIAGGLVAAVGVILVGVLATPAGRDGQ